MDYMIRARNSLMTEKAAMGSCKARLTTTKECHPEAARQRHREVVNRAKQDGEDDRDRHGRNTDQPPLRRWLEPKRC